MCPPAKHIVQSPHVRVLSALARGLTRASGLAAWVQAGTWAHVSGMGEIPPRGGAAGIHRRRGGCPKPGAEPSTNYFQHAKK